MKQFTLLWIENQDYKMVAMKTFLDFQKLLEYKEECLPNTKLKGVDNGYVWFCEE